MSCKDEKTVNKTTICGSTGYPVPTTSLEPQPQWTGEMASADSAWGKGFLMNLRDGKFSEPARLPNGDWRVNLDSDCGPAFVIIHHDNTFHRHLAVLFDEKGRRVARITSDGNTHTEALESLRQIAAYEDSAIFNMHIEQARHEKLEASRRKKMGEAVSRVQIRNSDGKTLIDALMSRGGNEMVEFKMTDVGTQWYLRRSDCPNDSILLRERAMQNYARMLITDLNKPGQPEYVAMYPEGIDHNGVERAAGG